MLITVKRRNILHMKREECYDIQWDVPGRPRMCSKRGNRRETALVLYALFTVEYPDKNEYEIWSEITHATDIATERGKDSCYSTLTDAFSWDTREDDFDVPDQD